MSVRMKLPRVLSVLCLALLALSACGEVRESLGLGRNPPDEFSVVDRPPLSMPPDFGLRPPQPGAPRPQEIDMKQRANDTLFGSNGNKVTSAPLDTAGLSGAEKSLLENTGATKADPDIRNTVDREASDKVVSSPHLIEELLWWKPPEQQGTIVNAPEEAARIKENKEKGEPVNQGATPIIEKKKSGWLGL